VPNDAPLAIAAPHNLHYVLELNMPDDWTVSFAEWHSKNDSYQFDFVPQVAGRTIRLEFVFNTFTDHIPPGLLTQYREDYKKMLEMVEFKLSITRPGSGPSQSLSPEPKDFSGGWPAIWTCFAIGVALTALIKWLRRPQTP
jgi:hypothetical protein